MTDSKLEPDPGRDARIRERAYHLWEADGRPHGRDAEYWERAEELTAIEDSRGAGQLPNPLSQNAPIPGVTVEEAQIQENYGEFPGALTDQGDRAQTPGPRKKPVAGKKTRKPPSRGGPR
jgi:hypothetical protein